MALDRFRISSRACAAVLVGTLISVATPANAHLDTCVGTGTLTLDSGVYHEFEMIRFNISFSLTLTGACGAGFGAVSLAGVLSQASCTSASGSGDVNDDDDPAPDHTFTIASVSGVWQFAGGVIGSLPGVPQGSCSNNGTNPGVSTFLVSGQLTLV